MAFLRRADPGAEGERLAARFLRKLGYRVIRRNCRSTLGELDLVLRDHDEVVFVEVKTRASARWGDPEAAVTPAKRRRLARAAVQFAERHDLRSLPLRFDVVAVLLPPGAPPEIRHYPNAFPIMR